VAPAATRSVRDSVPLSGYRAHAYVRRHLSDRAEAESPAQTARRHDRNLARMIARSIHRLATHQPYEAIHEKIYRNESAH
jgi:hypothetical protein